MKKQLFTMSNESGFFLPYVLFITALVFIIVTASIKTYQHEVEISHHLIDQLKAETIVQMGLAKFNQDYLPPKQDTLNVHYSFPDGDVTIIYNFIDHFEYRLHFTVITNTGLAYTTLITTKADPNAQSTSSFLI